MRRRLFILFFLPFLYSCDVIYSLLIPPVPKELATWQESKFFYGKSTGISEVINIGGYWLCEDSDSITSYYSDALLFFDDGTSGNFMFRRNKNDDGVVDFPRGEPGVDLEKAFESEKYWSLASCYDLRNDTICMDAYSMHPYWWNLVKLRFKVISRDTIELVAIKTFGSEQMREWIPMSKRFSFVPTCSLPNPDKVRIKKKKWIWRDEKDWKVFKQQHR